MLDNPSLEKIALKFSYTEKLKLMFTIHRFHICDFAYLLNFICNGKKNSMVLFWSCAEQKKNLDQTCMFPAEVEQSDTLPVLGRTVKKCPFCYLVKPFLCVRAFC